MATERKQVYKCLVCGIVVETLDGGAGEPVCCGRPMELQRPNVADAEPGKHVPVLSGSEDAGWTVTVGEQPHPMAPKHHIQWVSIRKGPHLCRRELSPGDRPRAEFSPGPRPEEVRAFCNLHGLWEAQG